MRVIIIYGKNQLIRTLKLDVKMINDMKDMIDMKTHNNDHDHLHRFRIIHLLLSVVIIISYYLCLQIWCTI